MIRYYNRSRIINRISSVARKLKNTFLVSLIVLLTMLSGSCEKGILRLGDDILPNGDMVALAGTDTLSSFAYTMFDAKFRTENPSISFLGQTYDSYFGTTDAEFVTQIRLGAKWNDSTTHTVDSVRLYLNLLTAIGTSNTDAVHTLRISEIADQIYTDSAYYSDETVNLAGYVMPSIELTGLKTDTTNILELKLPTEFGNYLIRDPSMLFYSNTKTDFRSYFKGLYFQMNSSDEPLMVSLSIAPPAIMGNFYNSIVLYMHDAEGTAEAFSFIIDASNRNAGYNRITHDFSTASGGSRMVHVNTTYKDTLSYLQGLNGVYTKISFPGLEDIKNDPAFDNIGVNKAKLVVPVYFDNEGGSKYISKSFPLNLQLRYKVKEGSKFDVPDYSIEATYHSFFDGQLDTVNQVYNFNIPAFVQAYLEDTENKVDPEVEIYQSLGIRNVIFRANNNSNPPKFEFTYTKF
jgi:hypothetical protein